MAKISTYPIVSIPTLNDLLIGTDVENLNNTKNFSISDIGNLIVVGNYVPYVGATQDTFLGAFNITANSFINSNGTASDFLKADGSLDSTVYQPAGNYITSLSGEASGSGPGVTNVTLNNGAVIGKVLTGLNVTGGSISSTDSILQAFGKLQNQVNSLYGGAIYQGTWNALTNNPLLQSGVGTQGWYYIVNVAGSTNLDGITDWNVGDWAIFDGTAWQQVDNTDTVVSVNGQVGVVVLTTTNIAEGTNLYFTDSRARSAISLTTTGNSGASTYSTISGILNVPNYTLSGLGGVPTTRTLTINGTSYDLSVDRSWAVGSVTNIATSAPLTGGVITSTGTIGITQAGSSSNGYLSSTDWNTFNNKQNALTNPVTGTGTLYYIPMWNGVSSLTDSILSYSSNTVAFNYNSVVGATVNYVNNGGTPYAYTIQMNNFGSPRQTYHSYTDGNILQQINNNVVSKNLQSGQLVLPYYTATSSFTGTAAGYLGFDTSGNILSLAIPSLAGYVPYTGATQDVNLGEFGLTAGQLTLDTSPTGTPVVATTSWSNSMGVTQTLLKGGNVSLKNGVDLVARVVNKVNPNQTLTKAQYQAVRVSGAQGQRLAVALAQADGDPNSAETLGLVIETIPTNQEGFIITVGQLEGINTTGSLQGESWSDGDVIYLSPTTPGAVTNIKPNASTGHIVVMGYVEYAHINNGKIYVKIMNGWELDELHNVYINTPLNNQGLFYTSSTQLWENKSIATALGYTPVNRGGDTMTGYLILNADPIAGLGAATKDYVDNLINGIDWKQAANAGTVASLPSYVVSGSGQVLTGAVNGAIPSATTDGVTLVASNRVLVKDETSTLTPNNGIYVVTQAGDALNPFILTRASDANTSSELSEATISIIGGNTLISTQWHCNPAAVPIIIGTTYITFNEIGSGVYLGTAPIVVSGNNISITQATTSTNGYLSSTDWNTFNNKQSTLSLTTSGSSGSSTLISNTLNVPTYTLNGLGGASATTTLTINGTTYDLSANRSWSVGTVTSIFTSGPITGGTITSSGTIGINQSNAGTDGYLSSTDWNTFNSKQNTITLTTTGSSGSSTFGANILNVPTYTLSGLGGVPTSRTLTINGTAYDLSLDRSWSVGTVTSVAALTIGTSGTDITSTVANSSTTPVITLNIPTASAINRGALSSTDWNTFNGKQDTITLTTTGTSGAATFTSNTLNIPQYQSVLTNPVTGTGTTNYIPKWTSSSAIGNSSLQELGTGWAKLGSSSNSTGELDIEGNNAAMLQLYDGYSTNTIQTFNSSAFTILNQIGATSTNLMNYDYTSKALTFQTNGNNTRLTISSTGAATFGSSVTASSLVKTGGTSTQYLMADGSTSTLTNPVTGTGTTNYLPKWTSSSALGNSLVYDNGTNVGIGTTSPAQKLSVVGNITATGYVGAGTGSDQAILQTGYLQFYNAAVSSKYIKLSDDSTTIDAIGFSKNGSASTVWFPSGNVGIGTTSPQTKIDTLGVIRSSTTTFTSGGNIGRFGFGSPNYSDTLFSEISSNFEGANWFNGANLIFKTSSSGDITANASIERMRITAGGQLKLNNYTSSSSFPGTSVATLAVDSSGNVITTTGGGGGGMAIGGTVTSGTTGSVLFINPTATLAQDNANFFWDDTNNRLGVGTATPAYRLDVNGTGRYSDNLLVSANRSSPTAFDVSNTTSGTTAQVYVNLTTDTGAGNFVIGKRSTLFTAFKIISGKDAYLINASTGGDIAILNDFSTGKIKFAAGASSTAQMTLTAAGRLLLGTTTESTFLLDVNGTGRYTGQLQSTAANSTATGGGQLYLNGATGNRIDFNTNGVAAPAFTTRSAGTKIVLYPGISASSVDFALGIEGSTLWSSVPDASAQFKWYAGTTNILTLTGAAAMTLSKNQNASTGIEISNTTNNNNAFAELVLRTNASFTSRIGRCSPSSGITSIITPNDTFIRHFGDGNLVLDCANPPGDIILSAGNSGQAQLRLKSLGQLRLSNYTSSSAFTGTSVASLGVDSSGNVITTPAASSLTTLDVYLIKETYK